MSLLVARPNGKLDSDATAALFLRLFAMGKETVYDSELQDFIANDDLWNTEGAWSMCHRFYEDQMDEMILKVQNSAHRLLNHTSTVHKITSEWFYVGWYLAEIDYNGLAQILASDYVSPETREVLAVSLETKQKKLDEQKARVARFRSDLADRKALRAMAAQKKQQPTA